MSIDASQQFRASLARVLFHFLPLAGRQLSQAVRLSFSLARLSESRSREIEGEKRSLLCGVVAVMNASWGNGVPLIVQRVVPPLRLSRFFSPRSFAALFRSFVPPLSLSLFLSCFAFRFSAAGESVASLRCTVMLPLF